MKKEEKEKEMKRRGREKKREMKKMKVMMKKMKMMMKKRTKMMKSERMDSEEPSKPEKPLTDSSLTIVLKQWKVPVYFGITPAAICCD